MVETAVGPIVDDIWNRLVTAIGKQLGYLIHYNRNIKDLNEQVEKLECLINDNQRSIQAATNNNEEIRDEIENWMKRADAIMLEAKQNLEDANANKRCFFEWCPDLISRYRLSRKANKKVMTFTQLEDEGKFQSISNPAPPPRIEFMSSRDFITFETTRLVMEEVMEALKEDKINLIGIHGMGGAGKTTLVKEIAKKAKEDDHFDNVVFAVVSQNVVFEKIQDQLADQLGLRFNEQSELGRACQLHARLKKEKKILVILDDVWVDRFNVKDIGIPMGVDHEGCKMIITTRRERVCRTMGMGSETPKIIHLGVLSETESWDLFRRNTGDVIDSPILMAVAREVASECRGLPIALVIVGRAMRGNDVKEWEEAAKLLKKSVPEKIEGVDQELFKCMKLSYDYLKDEEAKSCFFLCSLFPEDHDILIEDLMRYGMGLGIFKNVDTINEARGSIYTKIKNLIASCLLLAGYEEGYVKMHDVVRDVAISMGSSKYLVRAGGNLKEWPEVETLKHCSGLSLMYNQITEHPDALECPNLEILLMQGSSNTAHQMPEGVFTGIKALRVLDQSSSMCERLEPSFSYLTNLRTLFLKRRRFTDTTALGEIKTLEILSFAKCTFRESLDAMRHLTKLRLLDLTSCKSVSNNSSIIPPGVISRLSKLEELYMKVPSSYFTSFAKNLTIPSIVELGSLHNLTILTMYIDDLGYIPRNFIFPSRMEIFKIFIGTGRISLSTIKPNNLMIRGGGKDRQQSKMLPLRSLKFIGALLPRTNYLSLSQLEGFSNVLPDLSLDEYSNLNVLKTLKVEDCDELEYLINTKELRIRSQAQQQQKLGFYDLEKLYLVGLKNFIGLYHGALPHDMSLKKLKEMNVESCPKLSNLFPRSESLQELEKLKVTKCETLEHIFEHEFEGPFVEKKEILASLRELTLEQVYGLKHIWKGPTSQVILRNLQFVHIRYCLKLKTLFVPAIARTLEKLEDLEVILCNELEEIVAKELEGHEEGDEVVNEIVFPQLKTIRLDWLCNLNGFCRGSFSFDWPSLELVELNGCSKLITFTAAVATDGTQSFAPLELLQRLQELEISRCEAMEHIFDLKHEGPLVENKELLASLQKLKLEDLVELKHIWKGPTAHIILHNLQELSIEKCIKLRNIFPPAIARRLEKLEVLEVSGCTELQEIVAREPSEREEGDEAVNKIVFPRLKTLYLYGLSNLNGFCRGSFSFDWPSLESVKVKECPKMKTFTAAFATDGTQRLKDLQIRRCEAMEHIFDLEHEGPLIEKKELLPSFRKLELNNLYELKSIWKGPTRQVVLHNLQEVSIWGCIKLKSLFPPAIARTLEKLKVLKVSECTKLEEIVAKEPEEHEEGEVAINKIVFPRLGKLYLRELSNLNGFCMESFSFEWPSLEYVTILECPKMKTFTAADETQSTPRLMKIELDGVRIHLLDINLAIQEHFKEQEERIASEMESSYELNDPQSSTQ